MMLFFTVVSAISIHALREEGDLVTQAESCPTKISIHALREEGDAGSPGSFLG